jgi:XTP/dITP diphosphohydrolase
MTDLLIGTTNAGKVREYAALYADLIAAGVTLKSLRDVGLAAFDVDEPYATYEENARHKAQTYAEKAGMIALADDSGISVDALDGRPGVYSARYAGAGASDRDRYEKLLGELEGVPDERRTARFVCVIAVFDPRTGEIAYGRGEVAGQIARAPDAEAIHGFGYDPIFIPDGYRVSIGTLPPAEKDAISHRGRAARAAEAGVRRLLGVD